MKDILVSFCIPTNGIVEWVIPVVESIYNNQIDNELFEVIITDNGIDARLEEELHDYLEKYKNLNYKKTNAKQFLNQIEAFKLAKGELIKFVNHRMTFFPEAITFYLNYVEKYRDDKPVTYFLNGAMKYEVDVLSCDNFDSYVRALSFWSSWSAGTAVWKSDFINIDLCKEFNSLFPHTDLIFSEKNKKKYNIVNVPLMQELNVDPTQKGKYNLFYAFAVEYIKIIEDLYINEYISQNTFEYIKRENLKFIADLYWEFLILKRPNSYNLQGYKDAIRVYYSRTQLGLQLGYCILRKICGRVLRKKD